ncbi:hypothetical protein [Streptomyces sp. SCL15-4]|uniref:hypothetical protein n=1 Tax=Streptomyces sp. SCL15-4 TaxID=2967221 RepID=UPI002966C606|nr:hypothetical protein [Streptomyces sp. SCL15-4]
MGYRKTVRKIEVSLKGHKVYGQDADYPLAYARGKNLGEYLHLVGFAETDEDGETNYLVKQLEAFGDALVSWNLETEDGTPVPCTREGLFSIDNDLALSLAKEWIDCLGGKVDEASPLDSNSPSGEPSPVASIPMETLSAPQPNTSVPA